MARLLLWIAIGMGLAGLLTAPWWAIGTFLAAGVVVIAGFLWGARGMSDAPTPTDRHY